MSDTNALLRSIPSMEELLNMPWAANFSADMGREYVKKAITEALEGLRREIHDGKLVNSGSPVPEMRCSRLNTSGTNPKAEMLELAESRVTASLSQNSSSTLKPVVNATGVIIHTNLGRAPLASEALKAVNNIAGTYSTLEYSPENGGRNGRNSHVEWLICHICGVEAALVVNNNAAAVLLALSATAAGREVIVSNGELVEIGDSFRIPEILSFSGAKMVAVGCTNSTRITDYRNAITENTAVLLKVHPSNYRIEGFVASTSREELAEFASSRNLVFMEDLGSGLLHNLKVPFAHLEHSARGSLEAGAGIVTFSGDKLLGGPQIGVIAGSKRLIDKMRSHQLLRALRVDKMTLAAFESTLRMYITGRQTEIPVIKMIEVDKSVLQKKARYLCQALKRKAKALATDNFTIEVIETEDAIGGGAFPTGLLPGFGVAISPGREPRLNGASAVGCALLNTESLAMTFRTFSVPVITGIRDGKVIIHVRTLLDGDEQIIASSFADILGAAK